MALEIKLYPLLSEQFYKLKKRMDSNVYDTKDTAVPYFGNFKLVGYGGVVGEVVTIYRNDVQLMTIQTDNQGGFEVSVPVLYEVSNSYYAYGSVSGKSNLIVFDVYNYLIYLYLFSLQFVDIIQGLAQAKQDIYIDPKVGDDIQPLWKTESKTYFSSYWSLRDKMTLPIPSDYWCTTISKVVKKALEISNKGPVVGSLLALQECYENIGVSKIFVHHVSNPIYWNVDIDHIPHVKSPDMRNVLVIPENTKIRLGWRYMYASRGSKEIIFSGVQDKYYWVYCDGEKERDDTLKVKVSMEQPLPGLYLAEHTFTENQILTDDEKGTITGIPYQRYVTLVPPVASVSSSVSIYDSSSVYSNAYLVSREILALGVANAPSTSNDVLTVKYEYYSQPEILCVLHFDSESRIDKIMRIWAVPNHIRAVNLEDYENYCAINIAFDTVPPNYQEVLLNIAGVLREIVPVVVSFVPYVNLAKDDQEYIEEDSLYWSGQFKGFALLSDLVSRYEEYV